MSDQVLQIINNLNSYIVWIGGTQTVFTLKVLGALISLTFIGLIALLVIKLQIIDGWFKTAGSFLLTHAFPKRHLNKSWNKILLRLSKNDEANLRLALIEADNIFDD